MSFLDDLKKQAGEAFKFFQANPSPNQFVQKSIGQVGSALDKRFSQPLYQRPPQQPTNMSVPFQQQKPQVRFSDIARPAYQIAKGVTGAEQMFGKALGYYGRPYPWIPSQASQDVKEAQRQNIILQNQRNIATKLLQDNPNHFNRENLLKIIQQPGQQGIQQEYNYTPKQVAGAALGTGLDVATAGTLPGIKSGVSKFVSNVGGGAALGAGYGTAQGMQENKTVKDITKQAGLYAAGGAALGLALFGGQKLANRLIQRKKIYTTLQQSDQVKDVLKKTNNSINPLAAQDALDDATLQIQYHLGEDSQPIVNKLGAIDVNKANTWDELTEMATTGIDDAVTKKDIVSHINTRRIWTYDPEVVTSVAKQNNIDDIQSIFKPIREELTGPDVLAGPLSKTGLVEKIGSEADQLLKGFSDRSLLYKDADKLIQDTIEKSNYQKKVVTWDETKEIADKLGLNIAEISQKKAGKLSGPEVLAIRDVLNANSDFVVAAQKKLNDSTNPLLTSQADDLERKIELAMRQNQELVDKFLPARSQFGRDLNSMKIIANRSLDPANWLAITKRVIGGDKLPDEVQQKVLQFIDQQDRSGLVNYIGSLQKSTFGEKGITLWKAGLLTNPVSHIKNLVGNSIMTGLETVKDVPATMIDWALGLGTKQRTKTIAPIQKGVASTQGLGKGITLAKKFFKTGIDPDELLKKYDIPKDVKYNNPIIQGYVDLVFRSLGAGDKIFRHKMVQRSLMEEAIVRSKQLVKNGDIQPSALKETIQQLYQNPTDDMANIAIDAADYVTFQSDNVFSAMASGAKRSADKFGARPVVEFIMPFTKTPSNVVKSIADYSPVGIANTLVSQLKRGYNQKKLAEGLGRGITGSMVMALGSALASEGKLTGAPSEDSKERNIQQASGELSRAVKIGDTWVQINQFSPMGNLLVLGADLYNTFTKAKEEGGLGSALQETAVQGGLSTLQQVTDQPFLQGVSGALNAITQPERSANSFIEQAVSSVVPSIFASIGRGIDPTLRESQEESIVGKSIDAIKKKIPGLSKSVDPRRNMIGQEQTILGNKPGEPEQRTKGQVFGDVLEALFNPAIYSKETKNPVIQEMKRLDHGTPIPTKEVLTFPGVDGSIKLGPNRRDEYTRIVGAHYYNFSKDAITNPKYQWNTLNDDQKREILDAIYKEARKMGDLYLQTEYIKNKFNTQPQQ